MPVAVLCRSLAMMPGGRQRNATDWTYNGTLPEPKFERGYTFHEQLTEFDLINMNGRVYDPFIARFMSPDPFTQDPGNLQGYKPL